MSNSFRIDVTEVREWHEAAARRIDVRGVAALAKELEAHVARAEPDGTVVVSRHQLFTWAEALQGASARGASELTAPANAMRAILGGKVQAPIDIAPTPVNRAAAALGVAPVPQRIDTAYTPPASVEYRSAAGAGPGARLVSGAELAASVRELIHGARTELFVSSPWPSGVETMLPELVALPPTLRVLIVSRRPEREDSAFHQAMDQLGRRRTVTAFSNHIQTRMVIQDDERALIGAASIPGPASREAALLITDRAAVAAVRAHFTRIHEEAAGGKY